MIKSKNDCIGMPRSIRSSIISKIVSWTIPRTPPLNSVNFALSKAESLHEEAKTSTYPSRDKTRRPEYGGINCSFHGTSHGLSECRQRGQSVISTSLPDRTPKSVMQRRQTTWPQYNTCTGVSNRHPKQVWWLSSDSAFCIYSCTNGLRYSSRWNVAASICVTLSILPCTLCRNFSFKLLNSSRTASRNASFSPITSLW